MFTPCAKAGGLISYGPDLPATVRTCAAYAERILDGAKPDDLPLDRATKFELLVNRTAAKMLDIKIPESIWLRAAEVRPV
jgi:putative ABC transport system substrate-binding protein